MSVRVALLAGTTGLVGGHCLQLLLADPAYDRIVALTRRPLPVSHPKLDARLVDYEHLDKELQDRQVGALFCCLGTTIKKAGTQKAFSRVEHDYPLILAQWASRSGVEQFLMVSALGADPRSRIFYSRVKGETERDIAALPIPSITYFRPSLLLGERSERRLREEAAAWLFRRVGFLFRGRLAAYRPNEAAQVAAAMLAYARGTRPGVHIVPAEEMHG